MSEANIERLHEEIFELKQDIEEYERRLSVSNETIDIYEKLVKHVEMQRDDLYQELQSNEMLINELEQQKAELISVVKATAELIEKFELWNELSFEILFSRIENVLKKYK